MKKFIIKYLRKHISNRPKHYHFWRWVASWFYNKENTEHILACISSYFYHNEKKFPLIDFTDIFVVNKDVYIYTRRPGLWIGLHGKTIDKLEESFNRNNTGEQYKIRFIEDKTSAQYHICLGLQILYDNF
jgi:ribosomal protein S3